MYYFYKLVFLIFSFLISNQVLAVTHINLGTFGNPMLSEWNATVHVKEQVQAASQLPFYTQAKSILFLGDGFSDDENTDAESETDFDSKDEDELTDYSLAETVQSFVSKNSTIYKTSCDCPKDLHFTQNNQIIYLNVDHTKMLPFLNNSMDSIVMRKGLCFCEDDKISCGGLSFDLNQEVIFFEEVIRVLNKKNLKASAVLSGTLNRKVGFSSLSFDQEKTLESNYKNILTYLESKYPNLSFEIVYSSHSLSIYNFVLNVDPSIVLNENGTTLLPCSTCYSEDDLQKKVTLFEGIRIKVKSI